MKHEETAEPVTASPEGTAGPATAAPAPPAPAAATPTTAGPGARDPDVAAGAFDWHRSYLIPAGVRFRATPAGELQAEGEAGASVEVPPQQIAWLLAFSRTQPAASAHAAVFGADTHAAAAGGRDEFAAAVTAWAAAGLLRPAAPASPLALAATAPARLALFAQAAEEYYGGRRRRFPLQSHFELQRPALFYPGLNTREVHDRRRFGWVAALEEAFPRIRAELDALLAGGGGFAPVFRGKTSAGEWAAAYLWSFGAKVEEVCRACPETARALAAVPGAAQFGTSLFSALAPHTRLAPHYGYSNAKLRCQLPLRVPNGCRLRVGDQEIAQEEGRCIVFDDSFLHSAWNDSSEPRYVLVFDFFHPDLTAAEVAYLAQLARRQELGRPYLGAAAAAERTAWTRPASPSPPAAAAGPAAAGALATGGAED